MLTYVHRPHCAYAHRVKVGEATYDASADLEPNTHDDAVYRRLWLAVILRAVEEAEGRNCWDRSYVHHPQAKRGVIGRLKRRARKWLTTDSRSLRQVCVLAGVDVEKLLRTYRGKYGEELGRGCGRRGI